MEILITEETKQRIWNRVKKIIDLTPEEGDINPEEK